MDQSFIGPMKESADMSRVQTFQHSQPRSVKSGKNQTLLGMGMASTNKENIPGALSGWNVERFVQT